MDHARASLISPARSPGASAGGAPWASVPASGGGLAWASATAPAHDAAEAGWGPLRLLLIEDSPAYAGLVEHMLRDTLGARLRVIYRDALSAAKLALLGERIDCVLLDLSLPDAHGLEALDVVQSTAPHVPVVVLTGAEDQGLAMRAVHDGAQDFLVKRLAERELLARSIRYAIERKRAEQRLAHRALHDSLTDLPNRALLLDRLGLALARSHRRAFALALLFLDLDRFKSINDSLGRDAGDELLIELAHRLRRIVRPSDTVARFGGDEFLVLCEELRSQREALFVAERTRAAVAEPVELRSRRVHLHASIGIACAAPGMTPEGIIREADVAMCRAKRNGSGLELFEAAMHAEALSALDTERELRGAIERDELRLHYQPVVELSRNPRRPGGCGPRGEEHAPGNVHPARPHARVLAVEALVRWRHRRRGLLMPDDFIGLAEETGLIVPIGEWVLSQSCRQLAAWQRERLVSPELSISVNLSLHQIAAPGFLDHVASVLGDSGLQPRHLCLEVTESSVAQDPASAAAALEGLKALGVTLALDDFGTGYSSLAALTSYPVDVVKIDRAFVAKLGPEPASAGMFEAVLGVVRAAHLRAVAEGVESPAQLALLERSRCDAAQGFLFARPAPASELLPRLAAIAGAQGTSE